LVDRLKTPPPLPPVAPARVANRSAYVDAAVRAEVAAVQSARVNRNAALFGAASALGQLVAGGQLTEREHAEALMSAASRHIAVGAYSARQAQQTIASGLRNGARRPRKVAA
ncbi:MAG TPA: DNA primase, partial [Pseudonocardiaceae bacterium]